MLRAAATCYALADKYSAFESDWFADLKPYSGGWVPRRMSEFVRNGLFMVEEGKEYLDQTKAMLNDMRRSIVDAYRRAGSAIESGNQVAAERLKKDADYAAECLVDAVRDGRKAEASLNVCIEEALSKQKPQKSMRDVAMEAVLKRDFERAGITLENSVLEQVTKAMLEDDLARIEQMLGAEACRKLFGTEQK
jgi:hypothetical protein